MSQIRLSISRLTCLLLNVWNLHNIFIIVKYSTGCLFHILFDKNYFKCIDRLETKQSHFGDASWASVHLSSPTPRWIFQNVFKVTKKKHQFRIIDPLCGETTGDQCIPRTKLVMRLPCYDVILCYEIINEWWFKNTRHSGFASLYSTRFYGIFVI